MLVHGGRARTPSAEIAEAIASALAAGLEARVQPREQVPDVVPVRVRQARLRPGALIRAVAAAFAVGFVTVGAVMIGASDATSRASAIERSAGAEARTTAPRTLSVPVVRHAVRAVPLSRGYGRVELPSSARGHRLYVDGRTVASPQMTIALPCGGHVLRIGSRGREHRIVLPCGGTASIPAE